MSTKQVLAVSVVPEGDKEVAAKLPALPKILGPMCPDLNRRVVGNIAFLDIRDCEVVEKFYEGCIAAKERLQPQLPDLSLNFYLALAGGRDHEEAMSFAQGLLTAIPHIPKILDGVVFYITHDVYEQLPPKYRDNYRSATQADDMKVHSRFSEGGSDCFVVSPIGPKKTAVRERADFVFETYIKQACESTNYRARRSDQIISPKIDIEMLKRLEESPMVVVYLGSPKYGWNPNVMYEFGCRDSCKKPLIVLRDATADGKPYDLPFDIQNYRCIDIPEDDKGSKDSYGSYIRTIRDYLEEAAPPPELAYSYPSATVEVAGGKAIIIEKTGDLEQLFDMSQVLRKNLQTDILPHLYECMAPEQMVAFENEQSKLIGNIMIGAYKDVHATVPMLFSKHRAFRGRAFLPVIVSHSNVGNVLRLNVIYVEVTGVLKKDTAGHFYCDLIGQPIPEPPPADVIPIKA